MVDDDDHRAAFQRVGNLLVLGDRVRAAKEKTEGAWVRKQKYERAKQGVKELAAVVEKLEAEREPLLGVREAERVNRQEVQTLSSSLASGGKALDLTTKAREEQKATVKKLDEAQAAWHQEELELKDEDYHLRAMEEASLHLAAFRVEMLGALRPTLEAIMTSFIHTLTEGRHDGVELNDTFGMRLMENGEAVDVISGGCQDLASLAMRIAISQLIAERSGRPLSLLMLDEPFGSLDHERRAGVMDLLRNLKDMFPQVILISHVEEAKQSVDHAIELEFIPSRGCARVKQPKKEAA